MDANELKVYQPVVDDLCDVLKRHQVDSKTGELLLGFTIGLSMGTRSAGSKATANEDSSQMESVCKSIAEGLIAALRDQLYKEIGRSQSPQPTSAPAPAPKPKS